MLFGKTMDLPNYFLQFHMRYHDQAMFGLYSDQQCNSLRNRKKVP